MLILLVYLLYIHLLLIIPLPEQMPLLELCCIYNATTKFHIGIFGLSKFMRYLFNVRVVLRKVLLVENRSTKKIDST
jgi:hypothetical protein